MRILLISLLFTLISLTAKTQPEHFSNIFQKQTKEDVGVMKNSPQKMVIAFTKNPETIVGDSTKHILYIRKYNSEGRLVFFHHYQNNKVKKYSYDKKGRVIAYYEEFINHKPILNFAIEYTKKGAITAIKNLDKTKQAQNISFNKNTKTILISDIGGYIYRYTLDKKNRLVQAKVEYYMSTRYNSTLSYTKKGLLIEENGTKEAGSSNVIFTTKYIYNEDVLVKKTTSSKPENVAVELIKDEDYTYENSLLSTIEVDDNRSKIIYNNTYDNLKRTIKTTYTRTDLLNGEIYYVYR